jgi:hypothetical protein
MDSRSDGFCQWTMRQRTDGKGDRAVFRKPRALTLDPAAEAFLLVGDVDTVRRVDLADGTVTTLAGGWHGFADSSREPASAWAPDRMKGVACFLGPAAIAISLGQAFIADEGNSAVRRLDLQTGELTTVAGHHFYPVYHPGPMIGELELSLNEAGRAYLPEGGTYDRARKEFHRTGASEETLQPRFATLSQPRGIAFDDRGRCLATLDQHIIRLDLGDRNPVPGPAAFLHEAKAGPAQASEGRGDRKAGSPAAGDAKAEGTDPPCGDGTPRPGWAPLSQTEEPYTLSLEE